MTCLLDAAGSARSLTNAGALTVMVGRDLTVSASMVVSDEALALTAVRDVILDTAQDLQNETRYRKESRSGFTSSMGSIGYGTSSLQE
ncbi:hypothetical protein, partial [Pseudothauera rhizosphaerae]